METPVATIYSLNEAGFLTGQSIAAINRAIDRKEIDAQGGGSRTMQRARRVGQAELRALAVIGAVGKDLTPAARRKVSAAVRRLPAKNSRVSVGVLDIRLDDVDARIAQRRARLEELRSLVEPQPNGDPIIRGTGNSVYVIAAFTRGQTVAEIIEDCPDMTPDLVAAAAEYAKVYPRPGRPLPTRSFTRMLVDLANSGAWDVETDEALVAPHLVPAP